MGHQEPLEDTIESLIVNLWTDSSDEDSPTTENNEMSDGIVSEIDEIH